MLGERFSITENIKKQNLRFFQKNLESRSAERPEANTLYGFET